MKLAIDSVQTSKGPRWLPKALLLAVLVMAAAACTDKPSTSDCEKLVKHLVDLEASASGGDTVPAVQRSELDQQKKKVIESIGLGYCEKDLSVDQVECGLKARSLEELARTCDQG